MSRVLALVVAVAMVAGALWFRDRQDSESAAVEAPPEPSVAATSQPRDEILTLNCATELFTACQQFAAETGAFELTTEQAGVAAQALVELDGEPTFDLWLVPAAFPEIVEVQREAQRPQAGPLPLEVSETLARSPLVMVGFTERLEVLDRVCGREVDWSCLGEQAGRPWTDLGLEGATGVVRPAHPDPVVSATGLLVMGSAVTSWAGRTDLSTADLDDEAFSAWFNRLETAIPSFTPTQLTDMLTRGLASFDVIGTTEADAVPRLATAAAPPAPVEVRYPDPLATVDVVLVAFPSAGPLDAVLAEYGDDLAIALQDSGWRVGGEPVAGAPALPEDAGLPSAGFLLALQQRWEEITP